MNKSTKIPVVIMSIFMLTTIATATLVVKPIGVVKTGVEYIDMGTIGHYTLILNTSSDPIGENLTWYATDPHIWAGINGFPTGQKGSYIINSHSKCSNLGPQILSCTQSFDLQVQPQSGAEIGNRVYTVDIDYNVEHRNGFSQYFADLIVTAGLPPVPELPTWILISVGLIGLLGLIRLRFGKKIGNKENDRFIG